MQYALVSWNWRWSLDRAASMRLWVSFKLVSRLMEWKMSAFKTNQCAILSQYPYAAIASRHWSLAPHRGRTVLITAIHKKFQIHTQLVSVNFIFERAKPEGRICLFGLGIAPWSIMSAYLYRFTAQWEFCRRCLSSEWHVVNVVK